MKKLEKKIKKNCRNFAHKTKKIIMEIITNPKKSLITFLNMIKETIQNYIEIQYIAYDRDDLECSNENSK